MPWKVIETDSKWCVFKLDADGNPDGESLACHATKDEANAQVAALYAEEKDDGKSADDVIKVGRRHSKRDYEALRGIRDAAKQIIERAIELGADEEDVADAVEAVESLMGTATRNAPDDLLTVKALGANRIGGYLVLWGAPDKKDITGEYFTPRTQRLTDIFKAVGRVPTLYQHGKDEKVQLDVVGAYDVMTPDEIGLWAETQLDMAGKYRQAIMSLARKGALGQSSQTLSSARAVNPDGEIVQWMIAEGSLTPTPAEYRMVERPVQEIKAAYQAIGLTLPGQADDEAKGAEEARLKALAAGKGKLELLKLLVK